MTLDDFFKETNLEKTFLIGYYGGSNFGDELLLEVLQNVLNQKGVKEASFYYANPKIYETYHHNFGYTMVVPSPMNLLHAIFKSNSIIIGGGGLWGLDFNKNVAIMSLILFIARFLLRKKVYLVGIGSYSSAPKWGRIFSFIATVSANMIFARDAETLSNMQKANKHVFQVPDLAFLLPGLNVDAYESDVKEYPLTQIVNQCGNIVLVSTRNFNERYSANVKVRSYSDALREYIATSKENIVLLLLNSREFDPAIYSFYEDLKKENSNVVSTVELTSNPLIMYSFLKQYHDNVRVIAPQFHMQILAYLANAKFLPLRYDNKNEQLFNQLSIKEWVDVGQVTVTDLK